jgi:phosphoribosylformylglycinamidine cyclo-ligase
MYKVFNMGHRMEIYLAPEYADQVISISRSMGVEAQIIGRVEDAQANKLTLVTPFGTFEY